MKRQKIEYFITLKLRGKSTVAVCPGSMQGDFGFNPYPKEQAILAPYSSVGSPVQLTLVVSTW